MNISELSGIPNLQGLANVSGINNIAYRLKSVQVLKGVGQIDSNVVKSDVLGLIGGAIAGYFIAKKWPNSVVKYVGIVVGAEAGVIIAQLIRSYINPASSVSRVTEKDFVEADYRMVS